MTEQPKILKTMGDESIKWQTCAICGERKQRIVREQGRPDYAICDNCHSAFVLENGGKLRMLYGQIPESMSATHAFAYKQWRTYFEIRNKAMQERGSDESEELPAGLKPTTAYSSNQDALLDQKAQETDLLYSQAKKLDPPPRRLQETGELPDLDELFKDLDKE